MGNSDSSNLNPAQDPDHHQDTLARPNQEGSLHTLVGTEGRLDRGGQDKGKVHPKDSTRDVRCSRERILPNHRASKGSSQVQDLSLIHI